MDRYLENYGIVKQNTLHMQKSFTYFTFRNAEQQRILWKIPDISQKSENGGNVITGLLYLISKAEITCKNQATISQNILQH